MSTQHANGMLIAIRDRKDSVVSHAQHQVLARMDIDERREPPSRNQHEQALISLVKAKDSTLLVLRDRGTVAWCPRWHVPFDERTEAATRDEEVRVCGESEMGAGTSW